jgi:threonine synthase
MLAIRRTIALMGPPGSGKTSVGRVLASPTRLNCQLIDVDDDVLERRWNESVASVLRRVGDDAFLRLEADALMALTTHDVPPRSVLSLTGSNPLPAGTMEHVRSALGATVVMLDADPAHIVDRCARMKVDRIVGQASRPLAAVLEARARRYNAEYDVRVMVDDGESPTAVAERVERAVVRAESAYVSTRGTRGHSFQQAVTSGLAPDGGLFWPELGLPRLERFELARLCRMPFQDLLLRGVLERFPLGGIRPPLVADAVQRAYASFADARIMPVTPLGPSLFIAEQWHGPSLSFKDLSLQLLPELLALCGESRPGLLVATSGDTGAAALEAFARMRLPVTVLFPSGGVSPVQELQMVTAARDALVLAVRGDFDACQAFVKRTLEDKALGRGLTSANSLNFGRLVPQIAYGLQAYAQMVQQGDVAFGDAIDVVVPTGNFGHVLGMVCAKRMGLPIDRIICASNDNNVLASFLRDGAYDLRSRPFVKTISPSMDILTSSNLERLIYMMLLDHSSHDDASGVVRELYKSLAHERVFQLPPSLRSRMSDTVTGDWCSQRDCLDTIGAVFRETGRAIDPHTAVAVAVARRHASRRPTLVCGTAHFAKFPQTVLAALEAHPSLERAALDVPRAQLAPLLQALQARVGAANPIPARVLSLPTQPINHQTVASVSELPSHVRAYFANPKF